MASTINEKNPTTFGVTVERVTSEEQERGSEEVEELKNPLTKVRSYSTVHSLTPAPSCEDFKAGIYTNKPAPIFSPFYQHPPTSFERLPCQPTRTYSTKTLPSVYEKDVESLIDESPIDEENNPFTSKISVERNLECRMWPSRKTLLEKRRLSDEMRMQRKTFGRARARWHNLPKRRRVTIQIVVALFIVAAMVGLSLGITVAAKGSFNALNGGNSPTRHR